MKRWIIALGTAWLLALGSARADAAGRTLTFGIVPQQAASKLAMLWGPVLGYLSGKTGFELVFKTAPNIPEFERRVRAGEYDLAYMNPYHFTVFNRAPGYRAMARQAGARIKGIIVVRRDDTVRDLAGLAGTELAFPAPAAFAATLLPQAELRQQGVPFTARYVSSHDSVYRGVAKGLFPAGGGIQRTFENVAPEVREQLRILWHTKGYTPHAIAAHPSLDEETFLKVQTAMVQMNESAEGRALLAAIKFDGLQAATDADWDDVRALRIGVLSEDRR